jgi:hypothetical protein
VLLVRARRLTVQGYTSRAWQDSIIQLHYIAAKYAIYGLYMLRIVGSFSKGIIWNVMEQIYVKSANSIGWT